MSEQGTTLEGNARLFAALGASAQDILPERQSFWNSFMKATTWGLGVVIFLLLFIYVFWG